MFPPSNVTKFVEGKPGNWDIQWGNYKWESIFVFAAPLGSSVSAKIKNKIRGNEFIELGLLLNVQPPDESYSFKLQNSEGQKTLAIIPNQKKLWISNIEQWTSAFLVFAAIYCEKSPSETPSLMKYMFIVRELGSRSGN